MIVHGTRSSFWMVAVPVAEEPSEGFETIKENVSSCSTTVSPITWMSTCFVVVTRREVQLLGVVTPV